MAGPLPLLLQNLHQRVLQDRILGVQLRLRRRRETRDMERHRRGILHTTGVTINPTMAYRATTNARMRFLQLPRMRRHRGNTQRQEGTVVMLGETPLAI